MKAAEFLKKKSDEIASACAILGVLIGICGFSFTIWQLNRTENALRASNAYQIQGDARQFAEEIISDEALQQAILMNGASASDIPRLRNSLWRMYNFYLSVYRQKVAGGISSGFAASFGEDFCQLLKSEFAALQWEIMMRRSMLNEAHSEMRSDWCE